ncbi:MAG: hypothetical protein H6719_28290 [Sandaracinaceae bacterium]|nr:hypothetical protein [Sandaracinaceae bacterium]
MKVAALRKAESEPAVREIPDADPVVGIATLLAPTDTGWRVRVGARERDASVDASVDPRLLTRSHESGARVVMETQGGQATIVGVLLTAPALTVDRDGDVHASVRRFVVEATDEAMLKTRRAMVRLGARDIEHYADEIKTRARDTVRLLGAIIRLN